LLAVFVLGLALALVWLLFAMNATGVDAIVYILPAIITPFGLLTLFLIIAPIVIASQAAKNKTLMSELQWAASDAGLQVAGADTDALLNWDLFNQVIETKNYFLLVFQQRRKLFQMIPKRAFASPQNEARFRALARNKIGDA